MGRLRSPNAAASVGVRQRLIAKLRADKHIFETVDPRMYLTPEEDWPADTSKPANLSTCRRVYSTASLRTRTVTASVCASTLTAVSVLRMMPIMTDESCLGGRRRLAADHHRRRRGCAVFSDRGGGTNGNLLHGRAVHGADLHC